MKWLSNIGVPEIVIALTIVATWVCALRRFTVTKSALFIALAVLCAGLLYNWAVPIRVITH